MSQLISGRCTLFEQHIASVHTALKFTNAALLFYHISKAQKNQTLSRHYKRTKTTNAQPTHSGYLDLHKPYLKYKP